MFHHDGPPCIVGRYRLLGRVMGKGNYARVEEALHLDLQEAHVAIKMIDTHTVQERYVLRNLHREATVLRHLNHPNIIAIFEVLRAGSHHCIVTELVGGGELCAHVGRQPRGHLDEQATLQFGAQLISAVAHMHSLNVVHRDLKMKNIMLTRRGDQVKIVDFGLGRMWSPTDPLRTHCGSPGYAAPEIYQRDRPYGPEVDLWSLGVVLYYMAVGRMPFPPCRDKGLTEDERRKRLVALISKGATDNHVKLMGHFSPDFRDLVQGLLTAKVSRRLTLQQMLEHPWVANRLRARQMLHIQYKLSSQERALILSKLSVMLKIPVQAIVAQCRQDAVGEIAAMYNILGHKQLSTYHASWAMRPVSPKRLATELAAATAVVAGVGARVGQGVAAEGGAHNDRRNASAGCHRHRGPPQHRPDVASTAGEEALTHNEGRVDQPDSSAEEAVTATGTGSWVTSLSTERSHSLGDLRSHGGGSGRGGRVHHPLPAPPRPLALLHHQVDVNAENGTMSVAADVKVYDGGREDELEAAPPGAATAAVGEENAPDSPQISVGKEGEAAATPPLSVGGGTSAADVVAGEYKVACLLTGDDGKERLEPLPETKVMFYTGSVLDSVHEALAAVTAPKFEPKVLQQLLQPAFGVTATPHGCPAIKSALASQTGLAAAARTRKAVSFSIITTTHSDSTTTTIAADEWRRETGVQVNLVSLFGDKFQDVAALPEEEHADVEAADDVPPTGRESRTAADEGEDGRGQQVHAAAPVSQLEKTPSAVEEEGGNPLARFLAADPGAAASASEGSCGQHNTGLSRQDAATTEKFLKTVPISRKVSPEPKKNIYETRRWPLRSPRTVYKRMIGHSKLSLSYLLSEQENLINIIDKIREGTASITAVHSTVLPAHKEESNRDESSTTEQPCPNKQECGQDESSQTLSSAVQPTLETTKEINLATISNKTSNAAIEKNGQGKTLISSKVSTANANKGSNSATRELPINENSKRPLNTVAEIVRAKVGSMRVRAKQTIPKQKQDVHQSKERRGKTPRYQRFFPNRYRVDLALVMTLERSRKSILPSIHGPWTSS